MQPLEDELKRALARQSAPDGFAERVLQRIDGDAGKIAGTTQRRQSAWRAIAAGLLLTAVAGGWAAQKAIERREGERARTEVLLALHIASSKVRTAQQHVYEIGSH
jgi:anti-sigma factor RsiW